MSLRRMRKHTSKQARRRVRSIVARTERMNANGRARSWERIQEDVVLRLSVAARRKRTRALALARGNQEAGK